MGSVVIQKSCHFPYRCKTASKMQMKNKNEKNLQVCQIRDAFFRIQKNEALTPNLSKTDYSLVVFHDGHQVYN